MSSRPKPDPARTELPETRPDVPVPDAAASPETVADVPIPAAPETLPEPVEPEADLLPHSWKIVRTVRPAMHVDEFFIVNRIGVGGNGVVFRALNQETAAEVALKFLALPQYEEETEELTRFRRRVELLERISHSAVVTPAEIRTFKDLHYLVLELYLGPYGTPMSLHDYARLCGGMIEPAVLRKIFLHLLDAMAHMHRHGILHCDLKPANILFRFKGNIHRGEDTYWRVELKVTDFGLVQLLGEQEFRTSVDTAIRLRQEGQGSGSDTDSLLLSYDYMSPQQRDGEPTSVQTDIYAMGLMLYRLLVGATGLPLRRASELRPHRVDPAWDEICACAMHEDQARRYASATDMAGAIAALEV